MTEGGGGSGRGEREEGEREVGEREVKVYPPSHIAIGCVPSSHWWSNGLLPRDTPTWIGLNPVSAGGRVGGGCGLSS